MSACARDDGPGRGYAVICSRNAWVSGSVENTAVENAVEEDINAMDSAVDNGLDAAANAVDNAGAAVENAGEAVEAAAENAAQ